MRLARVFLLALLTIVALTAVLAGKVLLDEWHAYGQSRNGANAARVFASGLRAAEKLSVERGPTNGLFAADAATIGEWTTRLARARAATDEAFDTLVSELQASASAGIRGSAREVTAIRYRLAAVRDEIDRLGAQLAAARDLNAIRGLVLQMVALVGNLAPVLNETELAVGAADPGLFKITAVARAAADMREFAGQLGSVFAAALAGGVPLTEVESFAVERLTGRIVSLAQQIENADKVVQMASVSDLVTGMKDFYLDSALGLIERLTAAGRTTGRYSLGGGAFVEIYVPAMQTILGVRDAALRQIFAAADRNQDEAVRSLLFTASIVGFIVLTTLGIFLLLRRRVILPLLHLTDVMDHVVRRAEVTVPDTARRDEIGEMARAVRVFQRDAQENDELRRTAEAATTAKSAFLAMMSHEIRTPMNGVMSMAEMLDQTELTEDQRGMSAIIRSSSSALLTIINDILDFSKIEAGKLEIESVPFSLVEVVEGVGELIAGRADDKAIDLVIDVDPGLADRRSGDPTRLRQILLNLAGNAIKFTDAGSVTVRVRGDSRPGEAQRLRFDVIDTGIGLTPGQQARLFQPFAQADTSTSRRYGGTGLGLSICHRLCQMMNGSVGVDSQPGAGSTFWFELPLPAVTAERERPAIAIDDARVVAAGFGDAERTVLAALLEAAGIVDVQWQSAETVHGENAIVLLRALPGDAGITERVAGAARIVVVAPRGLASTLRSPGVFATLTTPIRRRRLWHVLAAALDRVSLGQRQATADDEAIGWAPPPLEEARDGAALILVAEDNTTNQVVIRRLLTQRGYAHEIAGNGVEALALYEKGKDSYGLLLTDFHMPEMDGFALTRQIRQREEGYGRRPPAADRRPHRRRPARHRRAVPRGRHGRLSDQADRQPGPDVSAGEFRAAGAGPAPESRSGANRRIVRHAAGYRPRDPRHGASRCRVWRPERRGQDLRRRLRRRRAAHDRRHRARPQRAGGGRRPPRGARPQGRSQLRRGPASRADRRRPPGPARRQRSRHRRHPLSRSASHPRRAARRHSGASCRSSCLRGAMLPINYDYGKLKILVVEDDKHARTVIRSLLRQIGVRVIMEAANGRDGLVELVRDPPHIVLCDVHMQPVDGREFLKTLRGMKITRVKDTPVIFLTADASRDTVLFAKEFEIDGYLVKPPSVASLKARIDAIAETLKL